MDARGTQELGFCYHCGNRALQRIIDHTNLDEEGWSADGSPWEFPTTYVVAQCTTCSRYSIYADFHGFHRGDLKDFTEFDLLYPADIRLHHCVPKKIQDYYQEAIAVKERSPSSFANQVRKALEALCADRGEKKGKLAERLEALVKRGEIPSSIGQMTTILRELGNVGSHDDPSKKLTKEHVFVLDKFFRAVIEYVYVGPHEIKEFKDRFEKLPSITVVLTPPPVIKMSVPEPTVIHIPPAPEAKP